MTHRFPKISIVTASYKAERLIESTIRSILDQGYPNLEYIVLDGAGDNTASVLTRYNDQLSFWRSAPDEGQFPSINEGFQRATGDILCWLNADDMLLPQSLFVVAEVFAAHPSIDWISTLKPGAWDANGRLASVDRIPGFNKNAFLDGVFLKGEVRRSHWIQQESTFFTSRLWRKAGARMTPYQLAGDFALWCEFYKHAELIGVDYPLAGFRHLAGQRSSDITQYIHEARLALTALRVHSSHRGQSWLQRHIRNDSLFQNSRKVQRQFGYLGKKVYKPDISRTDSPWDLIEYTFLP